MSSQGTPTLLSLVQLCEMTQHGLMLILATQKKKPKNPPHPPGLGPPPHKLELIILQVLSRNFNEAILLLKYSPTVIPLNAVIIASNAILFSHLSSRVIAPISFHGEF